MPMAEKVVYHSSLSVNHFFVLCSRFGCCFYFFCCIYMGVVCYSIIKSDSIGCSQREVASFVDITCLLAEM